MRRQDEQHVPAGTPPPDDNEKDQASLCRTDANANGAPQYRCELEDGHHIQHWADGFGVSISPSGEMQFTRPDGLQIPPAPALPLPEQNLEELSRELRLDIDKNTVFCWSGDTPDYGMAIDGLEYRRNKNGIDEHVH